MLHLLHSNN